MRGLCKILLLRPLLLPTLTRSTSFSLQLGLRICPTPSAPPASLLDAAAAEDVAVEEEDEEGEAAEAATRVAVAVATVVAPVENGDVTELLIVLLIVFDCDCNTRGGDGSSIGKF